MSLRYERKYLVPNESMPALRRRLHPFVVHDPHSYITKKAIPQYTVRSIYLDSYDMECYIHKKSGIKLRRKLRIRGYNNNNDQSKVVFEIKRKTGDRLKKQRSVFYFRDMENLIRYSNIEDYILLNSHDGSNSMDNARRFFYHLRKKQYIPINLVVYEREAYFGRFDSGVRITLDKNIRSKLFPEFRDLYDDHALKPFFNSHFIMEIKYYTERMPVWARSILQEFKLRNDAISKYIIGYDVVRYNKNPIY
ncbi:MAG: VTC domain-containing protein [Bacteroidales bacterium]